MLIDGERFSHLLVKNEEEAYEKIKHEVIKLNQV